MAATIEAPEMTEEVVIPLSSNDTTPDIRDEKEFALAKAAISGTDMEVAQAAIDYNLAERDLVRMKAIQDRASLRPRSRARNLIDQREQKAKSLAVEAGNGLSENQRRAVEAIRRDTRDKIGDAAKGKYSKFLKPNELERSIKYMRFYEGLGRQAVEHSEAE